MSSEGCFPYFCLFFNQLELICDLTALKLNTFFSTDIKSLLSCNSKMALLIGQILRNGQSPVCLRCILIGQYSVERQRTLYGVAGTETRKRRLRNTWKSCMKRNIMRNPCKLSFWGFFFTLVRSKSYRTIIINKLDRSYHGRSQPSGMRLRDHMRY